MMETIVNQVRKWNWLMLYVLFYFCVCVSKEDKVIWLYKGSVLKGILSIWKYEYYKLIYIYT